MKECFRCLATLPLTEFYAHPRMNDGLLGKCKACAKRDANARYHEKRQDSAWAEREKARNRDRMRAKGVGPNWTSPLAPEKQKRIARNRLSNWLRNQKIKRPTVCEDCGKKSKRIHGHHLNYFQPLNVVWVCPPCHRKRHALHPERCLAHLEKAS